MENSTSPATWFRTANKEGVAGGLVIIGADFGPAGVEVKAETLAREGTNEDFTLLEIDPADLRGILEREKKSREEASEQAGENHG